MRLSRILIPFLIIMSLSCTKESVKLTYSRQETNIENYINTQKNADSTYYTVSNKGSVRLVMKDGEGDALKKNGTVSFFYAGYILTGTTLGANNLFATNREETASGAGWSLSGNSALSVKTYNLAKDELVEGLGNGLIGVRAGEECVILFSGKYGFGDRETGTIPANSALAYHIWVESVTND